jgi:hypothetical protein
LRRTAGILLATVGMWSGLMATPAVAASAPVVNWAHSVSDDLGTLEVSAKADAGVASLVAHIINEGTQQEVALVDDFVLTSGTVQNGVWRTPEPLQLDVLRGYKVVVDVTDADGNQASGPSYGSLAYLVDTTFSPLQVTPSTITYTDRTVQVTGTLTGKHPGTREISPVAGYEVDVFSMGAVGFSKIVTTDQAGSFTASLTMREPETVQASFAEASGPYLRANSESVEISVSPAQTRVTATPSSPEVDAGGSITLSGQVMWESPQGWQPVAGKSVGTMYCVTDDYCPGSSDAGATTDADGRYELTVKPWQTGYYLVIAGSNDPFVAVGRTRVDVVVWQPAAFTAFTASSDGAGNVVASGRIQFGNFTPYPVTVEIQYREHGTNTWSTMHTLNNSSAGDFSATVAYPGSGHWRAYFPGRPNMYRPTATTQVYVD